MDGYPAIQRWFSFGVCESSFFLFLNLLFSDDLFALVVAFLYGVSL